jgi:hypothetical protein
MLRGSLNSFLFLFDSPQPHTARHQLQLAADFVQATLARLEYVVVVLALKLQILTPTD